MLFRREKAQTAIEYLLLLALVATIVIISFSNLLPRVKDSSSEYFVKAAGSIMGLPAGQVTGNWCEWGPTLVPFHGSPSNQCIQKRLCDCPPPFGSGAICLGSDNRVVACPLGLRGSSRGGGGTGGDGDDNSGDGGSGGSVVGVGGPDDGAGVSGSTGDDGLGGP